MSRICDIRGFVPGITGGEWKRIGLKHFRLPIRAILFVYVYYFAYIAYMEEKKKDDRVTVKVPSLVHRKLAVLSAALGVPMYQAIDDLVTGQLNEMGIKVKD